MNSEFTAAAFCAIGAEKVVSNELKKLSPPEREAKYTILESGFGRVRFKADLAGLYRALMSLRAADRVLLETGAFPALDFDMLFDGTRNIPWELYIPRGMGLKVNKVRCSTSQLKAETSVQAIVHKAAAQRLCEKYGISRLPEPSTSQGLKEAELRVYIEKNKAAVMLDISGEPLFKRGYRTIGGIAPLRESVAAAIILLSGWKRKFPLYDPFCGSGSIVIEAALYAWDQAPGLGRYFALSDLAIGNRHTEETVRRELAEKADYTRHINIQGSDADEKAVSLTRANLKRALFLPKKKSGAAAQAGSNCLSGIEIHCLAMEKIKPQYDAAKGFIITNPPYGKRLGNNTEAEERYRNMECLNKAFSGWQMGLICDHSGFETHFGKKADKCREIKSGAADTWLYYYEKL